MKGVGKSVIRVCKKTYEGQQKDFMAEKNKVEKISRAFAFTAVKRDSKF